MSYASLIMGCQVEKNIRLCQLSCSSVTNFCVSRPSDFSKRDDSAPPAEDSDFIMEAAADDDGNASATAAACGSRITYRTLLA